MSSTSELRLVSRRLASTQPENLIPTVPELVGYLLRSGLPLSTPHDQKTKDGATTHGTIHKLKTQITSLLKGKTNKSRFIGVALTKAVIDVGGRECLQTSQPWVRSLIGILQKPDPFPSKELAIVTLTTIYLRAHVHPSLVREVVTPTLADFINASFQLIKKSAGSHAVAEVIFSSFATLLPLYATVFRPFGNQIRTETRPFIAPTSDNVLIPNSLRDAARQLLSLLPYSAAKNTSGEEWSVLVQGLLKDIHLTADQVFRSVDEHWSPSFIYPHAEVNFNHQPSGGGSSPNVFQSWTSIESGSQRLVGLIDFLTCILRSTTKDPVPVPVPIGFILEICARISHITPPSPSAKGPTTNTLKINPNADTQEYESLTASLPTLHTSTITLLSVLVQRLDSSILPRFSDILDQISRLFASTRHVPTFRLPTYSLLVHLLKIGGPTLEKPAVDTLQPAILAACRDMHSSVGNLAHLESEDAAKLEASSGGSTTNAAGILGNLDRYLAAPNGNSHHNNNGKTGTYSTSSTSGGALLHSLPTAQDPKLFHAAQSLLVAAVSLLPQHHILPPLRHFVDQTGVLCRSKEIMISSILNPFTARNGKLIPSVLPYLARQFPRDREVEVLRSNLLTRKAVIADLFVGDTAADNLDKLVEGGEDENSEEEEEDDDMAAEVTASKEAAAQLSEEARKVEVKSKASPFVFCNKNVAASASASKVEGEDDEEADTYDESAAMALPSFGSIDAAAAAWGYSKGGGELLMGLGEGREQEQYSTTESPPPSKRKLEDEEMEDGEKKPAKRVDIGEGDDSEVEDADLVMAFDDSEDASD